jgi:hypothetical protein
VIRAGRLLLGLGFGFQPGQLDERPGQLPQVRLVPLDAFHPDVTVSMMIRPTHVLRNLLSHAFDGFSCRYSGTIYFVKLVNDGVIYFVKRSVP